MVLERRTILHRTVNVDGALHADESQSLCTLCVCVGSASPKRLRSEYRERERERERRRTQEEIPRSLLLDPLHIPMCPRNYISPVLLRLMNSTLSWRG